MKRYIIFITSVLIVAFWGFSLGQSRNPKVVIEKASQLRLQGDMGFSGSLARFGVPSFASAPVATLREGMIYFNTVTHKLNVYLGSSWHESSMGISAVSRADSTDHAINNYASRSALMDTALAHVTRISNNEQNSIVLAMQILASQGNIATNTGNISTNTSNISTNTSNVALKLNKADSTNHAVDNFTSRSALTDTTESIREVVTADKDIVLPNTINTNKHGIIYKGTDLFLHNYTNTGGGVDNLFLGKGSGNLTNTKNGNTGLGRGTLSLLEKGEKNTAVGDGALSTLTDGSKDVAVGEYTGTITTSWAVADSLYQCTFVGHGIRAYANDDTNAIVIGAAVDSKGSNTVVLGNANINSTFLNGKLYVDDKPLDVSDVDLPYIDPSPYTTYMTLEDWWNTIQSAGKITGGVITDAGDGKIDITEGTGIIKITNNDTSKCRFIYWLGYLEMSLTNNSANYIYVDYNNGSPQIAVATSIPADHHTKIVLGLAYREDTTLHITTAGQYIANYIGNAFWKDIDVEGIFVWESGIAASESGVRYLALSAGYIYAGLTKITFSSYNSSSTALTAYYGDGGTGWNTTSVNQIDNTYYDDGSGSLKSLTLSYTCRYIYIDPDGHVFMVYGTSQYSKLGDAIEETFPTSLPDLLSSIGILTAKIIIKKNATNFEKLYSYFGVENPAGTVTDHNDLGSIQGGAADDYYHLKQTQHDSLIDWMNDVTLGSDGSLGLSGNLGVGVAVSSTEKLKVVATMATGTGFYSYITGSNTGSHIGNSLYGINATVYNPSGTTVTSAVGINAVVDHGSADTVSVMVGGDFLAKAWMNSGTNYATNIYGIRAETRSRYMITDIMQGISVKTNPTFGCVIDTIYGMYIDMAGDATNIGKAYGIYIDSPEASSDDNEYGLYQAGTDDKNKFCGSLEVSGPITSNEKIIDPTPSSDTQFNGTVASMTVGENVSFGELLYMKSDGKLWKADANSTSTMPAFYIATASISAAAAGYVGIAGGFARDDTWDWTVGGLLYASGTVGDITQTAPAVTGDQVQVVGVAITADVIHFMASPVLVEVK